MVDKRKPKDWTKTGTVAGYAEYLRKQSGAFAVVVVRRDDSVLAADLELAPTDVKGLVINHLSGLVQDLAIAREEKRKAARIVLDEIRE